MSSVPSGTASATSRTLGIPWTFFSNHGHILVALADDPNARLRDLAERVGITERAVQRLLGEMEEADVITRRRTGRRNSYEINREFRLRHPVEAHCTAGDLIDMVQTSRGTKQRRRRAKRGG